MKLQNISINNLRRRKTKMLFLVLGLVIAVSTVITLITVSRMMNADIAAKLDEFGANIIVVPNRTTSPSRMAGCRCQAFRLM